MTWVEWADVNILWSVYFRIDFPKLVGHEIKKKYLKAASQNISRYDTFCESEKDTCI